MMRKTALLFFMLIALSLISQKQDSLKVSKFNVGFSFSPDFCYHQLRSNGTGAWITDVYDTLEVGRLGYTGGTQFDFKICEKLSIGSGILFADRGERTKRYAVQPVTNYVNHYYYVDIPLKADYYFFRAKIKVYFTAGLNANIFLWGRSKVEIGRGQEKESVSINAKMSTVGLSALAGAGLDCPITDRWHFKLEPNFRRSLMPVAKDDLKKYFYSISLNLGLFCRL